MNLSDEETPDFDFIVQNAPPAVNPAMVGKNNKKKISADGGGWMFKDVIEYRVVNVDNHSDFKAFATLPEALDYRRVLPGKRTIGVLVRQNPYIDVNPDTGDLEVYNTNRYAMWPPAGVVKKVTQDLEAAKQRAARSHWGLERPSKYPVPENPWMIGKYNLLSGSGGGACYAAVLEYRVWEHAGGDDGCLVFGRVEEALEYCETHPYAEKPLALVRQNPWVKYVDGVPQLCHEDRITEWRLEWLDEEGSKDPEKALQREIEAAAAK